MDQTTVEKILAKMSDGLLPVQEPKKTWGGYGSGNPCAACDEPILPHLVEHEVDLESTTLLFHAACDAMWRGLRLGIGPASADRRRSS